MKLCRYCRPAFPISLACFLSLLLSVGWAEEHPVPLRGTIAQASTDPALTLEDVLRTVRQYHPKMFSADLERRIAGAKLLEKQGAFDPGINLETDVLRYNDFTKRGKISDTLDNDLSVTWLTRSGAKVAIGGRYNTGDVKPPLYPTGDTGEYFMGVKMPLLRGFRINDKVVAEQQAALGIPLADTAFSQNRLELLRNAGLAYWDWVAARRKQGVTNAVQSLAQVRLEAVSGRLAAGDIPAIDGVEAQQEVVRRQGAAVKAAREYQKAVLKLGIYLWGPDEKPLLLPGPNQVPEATNPPMRLSEEDWMEARKTALERRPELKALNIQQEITEIDLRYAKNLRLPILDMTLQPGLDTGGFSIGPTLKAGLVLTVPLRQRTATGLLQAARFKIQKLDLDQRFQLQQILVQVDDAVSAVNLAYDQYLAAKQEYDLAKRLERGEQDRFNLGDSTLFLVNQRERSSAESALKMIDIENELQQAKLTLRAVSGQL